MNTKQNIHKTLIYNIVKLNFFLIKCSSSMLVCRFTGLAYIDVKTLRPEHIVKESNGEIWIRKQREKTKTMCNVPLIDIPLKIMEKYKDHPEGIKKGVVLPVPSNQHMNRCLKAVANICGIEKNVTTHIGRHSFACVAVANKIPMEVVAKMLGHTDVKTTKIYARVQDLTIADEMNILRKKFAV